LGVETDYLLGVGPREEKEEWLGNVGGAAG